MIKLGKVVWFTLNGKRLCRRLSPHEGKHKISIESPVGKALVGKTVGDKLQVDAPGGPVEIEILEVKY